MGGFALEVTKISPENGRVRENDPDIFGTRNLATRRHDSNQLRSGQSAPRMSRVSANGRAAYYDQWRGRVGASPPMGGGDGVTSGIRRFKGKLIGTLAQFSHPDFTPFGSWRPPSRTLPRSGRA